MKLKKNKFGRTAYRVSELCLSTSNFSRYASQEESFAILDAFRETGGNFIQTSGICPGVNLGDVIAEALRENQKISEQGLMNYYRTQRR